MHHIADLDRSPKSAVRRQTLVIIVVCLLFTISAKALTPEDQANNDRSQDYGNRAREILLSAESRAIEACQVNRIEVPYTLWDPIRKNEYTINVVISVNWNGDCIDGKRDGEGVLSWVVERIRGNWRSVVTRQAEGRMVKGQRLGLWCHTFRLQVNGITATAGDESGCSVFAGHGKPLTANFRKQQDGTWLEFSKGVPTGTKVAASTLETLSARVLVGTNAGEVLADGSLVGQNVVLSGLSRNSKIVFAPSAARISLTEKRIALVLSSNTIEELERFRRERQALINASKVLSGDAAKYRDEFMHTSNPDRMLANVLKTLRRNAKLVVPEDDLIDLQKGKYDYAFIFDWKDKSRLDLLGKFDHFPVTERGQKDGFVACESLAGFLVTPELKVVKAMPGYSTVGCSRRTSDSLSGNLGYMKALADHYRYFGGDGIDDDLGADLVVNLHRFLKN